MPKLFISYLALVCRVSNGGIDEADLERGVFYFNCSRDEALAPLGDSTLTALWLPMADLETKKRVHETVSKALIKADVEGRVAWKERGVIQSYNGLNKLLDRNGCGKIDPEFTDDKGSYHPAVPFSCTGVAVRVKEAGLDLDVVY